MNDTAQRKLAAIFHADVFGYSKLMRDDEMATVKTISEYRELMSNLIRQHRGRTVDTSGDSVLAEFPSVVDAIQSAVSIQKELTARNIELSEHRRMQFRIGINIGDVIQEGDRIYGDGVNIAARLETLANPGGICISRVAYDQIESKLPLGYEYIGVQKVKNINKPLHAYRVIIDPVNNTDPKKTGEKRENRKKRHHAGQDFDSEQIKRSFHQVKDNVKAFAKEMKEDEQIGETYHDLKNRFNVMREEITGSPEQRKKVFHNLMQNQYLRTFLIISAILLVINVVTSFGNWWFQYPLVAIGLGCYLFWLKASFFSGEKIAQMQERLLERELGRLGDSERESSQSRHSAEQKVTQRIYFYNHLYVYIGVNAFLIVINLLTSPFNWWFHFPLIGWGIGLFLHWIKIK